MTIAARTGFLGLVTNVACTHAPEGALQEAENVVCRRVGAIEPRDGVDLLDTQANPGVWGFSLDDDYDLTAYWGGSAIVDWILSDGTPIVHTPPTGGSYAPQPLRRDVLTCARSRGRVYVPASDGTYVATTTALQSTGIPPYAVGSTPSTVSRTNNWLANTETVAYRVVTVKRGADGMIVSSIPNYGDSITNTAGADRAVNLTLVVSETYIDELTEVEVYRTRSFAPGVTVNDEMQLVATVDRSAFTGPSGGLYSYSLYDEISPNDRGKTLYTSPTRGGISQGNDRPPAAAAIAAFKGSLFFGNVRGPQSIAISHAWGDRTGSATGVGTRTITYDTNSNASLTNVTPTIGLERGQIVSGPGIVGGSIITNIAGSTVTISSPAVGTAAGLSGTAYDAVQIDGTWFDADRVYTAQAYQDGLVTYRVVPSVGGNDYTWVIETISRATGALTVRATHGSEYTPVLPTYAETALELSQDEYPGAIMWSKKDEPEHVPLLNREFVGDQEKAILGIVPTRDAIFVLKEDGIFRLTGAGATEGNAKPWRIDPYDPTTRCLLPTSVKPLNGRAYFLSNKGVVAFGDEGAEQLSKPVHDLFRDVIDEVIDNFQTSGFYELNGIVGSTAAVFERENEYTILRGATVKPLVYNENTRAWTSWRYFAPVSEGLSYLGVYTLEREGRVAYALGNSVYVTRLSTDDVTGALDLPLHADRVTAVTANSYAGGIVTLSSAVTAMVDDVIQDEDGKLWRVAIAANASATVYVDGPAGSFTTGSCQLYRSLRCAVAPQTFYGGQSAANDWELLTTMFSRFHGPVKLSYLYSSQLTELDWDSWTSRDVAFNRDDGYAVSKRGAAFPQDVPNSHYRAWLLDAGARWVMTHGTVRLEGVYAKSKPRAPRARMQDGAA